MADEMAPDLPCAVVMARREYEAWFLTAIESLQVGASYPENPELKRDAKGALRGFLPTYKPTTQQTALSARFDMGMAYRRASSFRKLVRELCRILNAVGSSAVVPAEWMPDAPPD